MEIVTAEDQELRLALAAEYRIAQAEADRAQERLSRAKNAMVSHMQSSKSKTITLIAGDRQTRFTYVAKEVTKIDEKGLRKELTAKVFDKFTDKKLNRSKLEAAMQAGQIDPMIVSKHVEIGEGQPYLRITEGAAE